MYVCKVCGNRYGDADAFCPSCGKSRDLFAEYIKEEPPPPPPKIEVAPQPEPEPDLIDRVKHVVGMDRPKIDAPPPAGYSASPAAVVEAPVDTAPKPMATGTGTSVAPGPEQERITPPRPAVTPERRPEPGDVMCPRCGAGNEKDRTFCRRCGYNLKAISVPVKIPWYRRFFPLRSTSSATPQTRSAVFERERPAGMFRIIALAVVVLLLLAYLVIAPLRTRVNDGVGALYATAHRHLLPSTTPVRPLDATSSSQVGTHTPMQSIDLITETYWAANTSTDKQPWLHIVFDGPVDIDTILITSGAANDYAALARPKEVKIVFSDDSSVTVTLKDDPKPQSFDLGSVRHTTFVEVHVLSVYPSQQSPNVAINEVEFFRIQ